MIALSIGLTGGMIIGAIGATRQWPMWFTLLCAIGWGSIIDILSILLTGTIQ